jgi:hypothetical protein
VILAGRPTDAGCATPSFIRTQGSGVYMDTGGVSRNMTGIDLWETGTPPRNFRIIGYITDERLGGPIAMAGRDRGMAAEAKRAGGDGLLLTGD